MKHLCNTCKWANWNLASVAGAICLENPEYKVLAEGNYVTECSAYKSNNIFRCILNVIIKRE